MTHFPAVELKHLQHFLAVADEGGISAAARRLGLTQPALSRQIKALEDDLGVTLLDCGARSFSLTPAVEANLGCAIMAETSRPVRDADPRVVPLAMEQQPEPITVAAGVSSRHAPPPHVLAFIEEMKLHGAA